MRQFKAILILMALAASITTRVAAQDLASFEKRVTVKKLPNGLTLLVLERPEAPVFSFFTYVDAGSAQDPKGATGLAHMFEHMAFKGTQNIGTTDYAAEKVSLEKVEAAYRAWREAAEGSVGRDEKKIAELEKTFKAAVDDADQYVKKNEFGEIVEREGGVGLNAFTASDQTGYFYSLPSNRLELWSYLESERFLHPVLREFYKERDVVGEERRMRTESQPIGRMVEQFLAAAFTAHPYGQPGVGWPSDLQSISATEAATFFNTYYGPSNLTVAVVGDVKAAEVVALVGKYFGRIPSAPKPPALHTIEPPQTAERQVILHDAAQPFYLEGYHKPSAYDKDDAVYDVIQDLMSSGRTSRLYRSLVRDKKVAAFSAGFNGFPGQKYPNMFALYAVPTPGHTPAEVRDVIRAEVEKLKTTDVSADELQMVKTRAKANLVRALSGNEGLAGQLATAQAQFGDWREIFRRVDEIDKVTAADVRRVSNQTFVETNRTVAEIESTQMAGAKKSGGAQ